jgi:NAD(P)-dependent dehydrogenase (short-subunit alcohol dehydrogenase family)
LEVRFDGQVAIVTGAGGGLGRSHAIGLAARGAKVLVVDVGADVDEVVDGINASGGEALGSSTDVTDFGAVHTAVDAVFRHWGRVDVLVNNAGILRDKSFAKMDMADFQKVMDVHLMGSVHFTKAVWGIMRQQNYGRIVMTSSSSGLYGNYGQSNYGSAKAAMLGLMNTLHLEGEKYDIRVNMLMPTAATNMTRGLLTPADEQLLTPESITPGVLFLASPEAPSRVILSAGAGSFARVIVLETAGIYLPESQRTPEGIAEAFHKISDPTSAVSVATAFAQIEKLVTLTRTSIGR